MGATAREWYKGKNIRYKSERQLHKMTTKELRVIKWLAKKDYQKYIHAIDHVIEWNKLDDID